MAISLHTVFHNIFGKLDEKDFIQIKTDISVRNSSNIYISGNTINNTVIIDAYGQNDKQDNKKNVYIDFTNNRSENKKERAILNIDYLEKFIFESNRQGVCPVFRYYGLFSHLSTLRSKTDFSDYNQLILKEKACFEKMLRLNYKIKLIISLDIPIIITKWGYSYQEAEKRIANLCENIDPMTKDHNIEIVIDEKNSMDSMYILDKCLLIKALTIDPVKKYSITQYETNPYVIDNIIDEFDKKFAYLRYRNNAVKKILRCDTYSSLIQIVVEGNLENYYDILNQKK